MHHLAFTNTDTRIDTSTIDGIHLAQTMGFNYFLVIRRVVFQYGRNVEFNTLNSNFAFKDEQAAEAFKAECPHPSRNNAVAIKGSRMGNFVVPLVN